jgi:hypothetical protein
VLNTPVVSAEALPHSYESLLRIEQRYWGVAGSGGALAATAGDRAGSLADCHQRGESSCLFCTRREHEDPCADEKYLSDSSVSTGGHLLAPSCTSLAMPLRGYRLSSLARPCYRQAVHPFVAFTVIPEAAGADTFTRLSLPVLDRCGSSLHLQLSAGVNHKVLYSISSLSGNATAVLIAVGWLSQQGVGLAMIVGCPPRDQLNVMYLLRWWVHSPPLSTERQYFSMRPLQVSA